MYSVEGKSPGKIQEPQKRQKGGVKMMWSKIIKANWDAITDAMQKAAHDVGESDGESILRVELNADGTVDTYWTFENITSPAVHDGTAIVVKDYFGGDFWEAEWADTYDAAADLEALFHDVRTQEWGKTHKTPWSKKNA